MHPRIQPTLASCRRAAYCLRKRNLHPSRWRTPLMSWGLLALLFPTVTAADETSPKIDFGRDVLPILSDNCFQCHGPDAGEGRKGDLRLDDEADAKRDRGGYSVITAGDADTSELFTRVTHDDDDMRMPPAGFNRTLKGSEVAILEAWINQGANWGKHWAFERVERPETDPQLGHPIDQLVNRQLQQAGIVPNGRASKPTLARRLFIDLTGLPPTPVQLEAFLADDAPDAWNKLVDQALASPRYGERMAWDWLEVARYADSNGYQGDNERTMWPWRDWVVDAFNRNLPYDQFTIWQLAGDLLPEATDEHVLATGFNRNHMINGEGGRIAEENRVDYVMDMTETMGTAWLGLTLNCCRCHDHKFDPLTRRDYYRFTAFFNQTPVNGGGGDPRTPPNLAVPSDDQRAKENQLLEKQQELAAAIAARLQQINPQQTEWEAAQLASDNANGWNTLSFAGIESLQGQSFHVDSTGAILTSGPNPANDTYTLIVDQTPLTLGSLWLEALQHDSMTKRGFARSDSGNFVLTEFNVAWRQNAESDWVPLTIASAEATYEQGDLAIAKAFDGDATTGWAVYDGKPMSRDHWGVFRLAEPVTIPEDGQLRIELHHDSRHQNHNLGSFRLSFTSEPFAKIPANSDRVRNLLAVPNEQRTPEQQSAVRAAFEQSDTQLVALRGQSAATASELENLRNGYPVVMVMRDMAEPRKTFMLDRGLYNQIGEEVTAGIPDVFNAMPPSDRANRLDLARWLVSRDHPLTSRVVVNRFWQSLFGVGLVKTAEDFGVQGEYPVQSELLDWLAAEFMESGWDVKHLIRLIVTSETYQRDSSIRDPVVYERDPENRYLARGARFRMPAWMLRDQALAVSGLLDSRLGGAPVFPYQPEGVWSEATFGNKKYVPSSGSDLYRRSIYTFWRRIVGPTMFFDTAKRQVCEVKPLRTNTPLHALATLNDVTYVEAARALAIAAIDHHQEADDQLRWVMQQVVCRDPSDRELSVLTNALQRCRLAYENDAAAGQQFLSIGETKLPDGFDPAQVAALSAVCLNILNLDETLTRE